MWELGGLLGKFIATTGILIIALAYLAVWIEKKKKKTAERMQKREATIQKLYENYRHHRSKTGTKRDY